MHCDEGCDNDKVDFSHTQIKILFIKPQLLTAQFYLNRTIFSLLEKPLNERRNDKVIFIDDHVHALMSNDTAEIC